MTPATQRYPRSYAGFEALPFIHSILKGAADGVEGVGILTDYDWLPDDVDGTDTWGDTWTEARSKWIRCVAPLLLPQPRHGPPQLPTTCPETWEAVRRLDCIEDVFAEYENGFVAVWLAIGWASSDWSGSRENPTITIHAHWDEDLENHSSGMTSQHWASALKDLQEKWGSIFWRGYT
jgi:hypothetical protein